MITALANPGLFWAGLGLVSVPILIHLFFRRRHRVVRWAAMDFLLAAIRKQKRRMEVENLILLLLRCLGILLLGLAIARPAVEAAGLNPFGGGARAVVLVVDTSTSMGARFTAREALDRAKERASQFVGDLPAGSQVTLIVTHDDTSGGAPATLIENASPAEARVRIRGIRLGYGPNDLGQLFRLAGEKLAALRGRRIVVFVTDLQRRDWYTPDGASRSANVYQALKSLDPEDAAEPTPVTLIDVGNDDNGNVAVTDVTVYQGRQAFAGEHLGISVSCVNFGRASAGGTLSLYTSRDGGTQWEKTEAREIRVDASLSVLEPNVATCEFRPRIPPKSEGPIRFKAVFTPHAGSKAVDRLPDDSERYLALSVRPPVQILPVRTHAGALEILEDVELLKVIDLAPAIYPNELADHDLSKVDILMWADAEGAHDLTEAAARKIDAFVRRGGGLLLYLGDLTQPDPFNRLFFAKDGTGLLPMRLGEWRHDADHPVTIDLSDPKTQSDPLFEDTEKYFFSPQFLQYRRVSDYDDDDVVARYSNGDPAVLKHDVGRGRVIAVTTTPDERAFRLNGSLLPAIFFFNAAHYLVWERPELRNRLVGAEFTIPLPPGTRSVAVTPPQGAGGISEEPVESGATEFVLAATSWPGFYRVTAKGLTAAGGTALATESSVDVAANLDKQESDLRRTAPAELQRDFQGIPLHFTERVEDVLPRSASGDRSELSRSLLGGVVLILLLELLFAWRFGKRRGATA